MSQQSASRHGGDSTFAVSSWPLRRKVALALAIPLLLAATLGGLRVASDLTEATNSSTSAQQVTVLRPVVDYLTASSRAMVAAQRDNRAGRADLETAVADLEAAAEDVFDTRGSADLTAEQSRQVEVISDLSRALREQSDTLSPGTWVAQVRQLQTGVTRLIGTIENAQLQPEPRLQQLSQALAGRFSLAIQQALVATERSGDTGSLELFAELGAEGAAIERLTSALGETEPVVTELLIDNAQRTRTVRTGGTDLGGPSAYAGYDALVGSLLDGIDAELAGSAEAARNRALLNGLITLGALLAAIFLALLVSRMLIGPIRRVREGALAVAHQRLPDAVARVRAGEDPGPITPIDVTTQEEVGQLARAVDDLHRQAVVLAAGEAGLRAQVSDMFVTLSRRNTSLVNQQLGLIDRLEKDEEDPARLESLFRLDHLASRMRRTGDSLLILADAPAPAGQAGLTVGQAMQAATAGVQDYRRVQVGSNLATLLSTDAAADVVHLLTELVDNALSYSAPTTNVLIGSTVRADGVVIDITDAGLGIPDDELAVINQRLRSGGEVTADTARRMGLFVVSRLARRHGIVAELNRNPRGGTTATVLLPPSILPELPGVLPRPTDTEAGRRVESPPVRPVPALVPDAEKSTAQKPEPVATPAVASLIDAPLPLPTRTPGSELDEEAPGLPRRQPARVPGAHASQASPPDPTPAPDEPAEPFDPLAAPLRLISHQINLDGEADTPIFKQMRSAWLSSGGADQPWISSEIEAGWEVAERVAETAVAPALSPAGLPMRRPGAHLVPGGVSKPTGSVARDPEAVRARLAAHAAGVSRGRRAATSNDHSSDDRA